MGLESGQTLLHYRLISQVGAGAMGEVYRAEDTKLGREIALKLLPSEMASDPDRFARFQREARAVAALNHPNRSVSSMWLFRLPMLSLKRMKKESPIVI
jgi:serine/threonine protein kinase